MVKPCRFMNECKLYYSKREIGIYALTEEFKVKNCEKFEEPPNCQLFSLLASIEYKSANEAYFGDK